MGTPSSTARTSPIEQARRIHSDRTVRKCRCCGEEIDPADEAVLQRGAVTVAFDPVAVFWHGQPMPLSPTEASVFAFIARRGRVSYDELDIFLADIRASPATRSLLIGHIRRKFTRIGACDPFERVGLAGVRLQVDPNLGGYSGAVIGVRLPRFARATG